MRLFLLYWLYLERSNVYSRVTDPLVNNFLSLSSKIYSQTPECF